MVIDCHRGSIYFKGFNTIDYHTTFSPHLRLYSATHNYSILDLVDMIGNTEITVCLSEPRPQFNFFTKIA